MSSHFPNIDERIVHHMNELKRCVEQDVQWMEHEPELNDYSIHVSNLESNLLKHAEQMLSLRERVIRQIATKCGRVGKDVYGRELSNIRIRRFFGKLAELFTHKREGAS